MSGTGAGPAPNPPDVKKADDAPKDSPPPEKKEDK
jgi:hypothetical protein